MKPRSIGIVGGMGQMGGMFSKLFMNAGYPVEIFDIKKGPVSPDSINRHQVIFITVPIAAMDKVLGHIGPHTRDDGVVIDIASLKEVPINSMLRNCRGEIIGSHPLFGPSTNSLKGQVIFICPARSTQWIEWLRDFFRERDAVVAEIDPRRHDELMAKVQVLRHFLLFSLGRSLIRLDFDFEGDLSLSGPWFSQLITMLDHQLEQPPELYADLAYFNPFSRQVVEQFFKTVQDMRDSYMSGGRQQLIAALREVTSEIRSGFPKKESEDSFRRTK